MQGDQAISLPPLRGGKWMQANGMTLQSIVIGTVLGCILCFSNMYFGLQTGWVTMASIQSAVLGFGIWKVVQRLANVLRQSNHRILTGIGAFLVSDTLSIEENVILQTVAVAAATMPLAAGFVGIIPALQIVKPTATNSAQAAVLESAGNQILWCLAICFIGVFLAVPLRARVIVQQKLKFPSGLATATAIAGIHGRQDLQASIIQGEDDSSKVDGPAHSPRMEESEMISLMPAAADEMSVASAASPATASLKVVSLCFIASSLFTFLAYFFPVIANIPIAGGSDVTAWGWVLALSPSYMGQGMIMGVKTCLSMLVGAVIGWGIIGPLAISRGWVDGGPMTWPNGGRGFILWISLSIMVTEAVTGLVLVTGHALYDMWRARRVSMRQTIPSDSNEEPPTPAATAVDPTADNVPRLWWITGLGVSCAVAFGILLPVAELTFAETLCALLVTIPISIVAIRALGETDLNPVSGLGKIAQGVFAVVSPGNVVGNILAGAVAEAGAQQAGDLMQDLKTGYLLKTSPKAQFFGQLIGSVLSVFVSVAAYAVLSGAYGVPSKTLPAPTANVWVAMAELMNGGSLPPNVMPWCVAAGLWAVLATVLEYVHAIAPPHHRSMLQTLTTYMPSATALAIGMYITPNWTTPRVLGSIVGLLWLRKHPKSSSVIMGATGLVLGEGITSIITAIMHTAGVPIATCDGCAAGMCGNACP